MPHTAVHVGDDGAEVFAAALTNSALGPVVLDRLLVAAPGAWMFQGRDDDRKRWLTQLALLKGDKSGLSELIRAIETETEGLADELAFESYGYDPDIGKNGGFYWHMPWTGATERFGQPSIDSLATLLNTARSLVQRLITRHEQRRLDPLLQAPLVVPRTGGADLLGVPISIPRGWIASPMHTPELAPEERSTGELKRSGDIWRLGTTIRALGHAVELSAPVDRWLGQLTDPDVHQRLQTGPEALFALDNAISEAEERPDPTLLGDLGSAPTLASVAMSDTDERTRPDIGYHAPGLSNQDDPDGDKDDEAPTIWLEKEEVARRKRESAVAAAQPLGPKGTVVGVRLHEHGGPPLEEPLAPPRPGRAPPTRVFDDPAQVGHHRSPVHPQQLPQMGNFGPGGTVAGDVPLYALNRRPSGDVPRAESHSPSVRSPSESSAPTPDLGDDLDMPPPRSSRSLGWTLLALVALAVGAAVVVQLLNPPIPVSTTSGTSSPPPTSLSVSQASVDPWNDVLLETIPNNAQVLSEVDGTLVGPSPVRMLVPRDTPTVVLVTAPGFEPVRLVMPVRGRITVHLTSVKDVVPCPVDIQAPGSHLEVVGHPKLTPQTPGRYRIPGAVVIRSTEGHGAWLVRCTSFGGQRRHHFVSRTADREVEIHVKSPKTAKVLFGKDAVGNAPVRQLISARMLRIEARLPPRKAGEGPRRVARWIPAFQDTTVELPRPPRAPQ